TLSLMLRVCIEERSPRAVLVVGPPGMGKTRLRHELMRRVQDAELRVLVGLGDPIRTTSSYGLLGGALARLCGLRAEAPPVENRAVLEERVGRHMPAAERLRAAVFLGELCGVRFPGDTLPELRGAQRDPRAMARFIEQAWVAFVRAEAAVGPVLLVLDDLQW